MRKKRPDSIGMHIAPGPIRPYGICPECNRNKPMHWISKKEYLCYDCLKGRRVEKIEPKPDNPFSGRKRFPASTDETISQHQLKRIRARAERDQNRAIKKKQKDE